MKFLHSFITGDWSMDGHEKSDTFIFKATHSREDIIKAYLEACEKLGVALHRESNEWKQNPNQLFCTHRDYFISEERIDELEAKGLDLSFLEKDEIYEDKLDCHPYDVFKIFMSMAKFSLPDFQYEDVDPPCINGWWQEDFNYQIGYGVYQ